MAWRPSSTYATLCCEKLPVSKNNGTFVCSSVLLSKLRKFRYGTSIVGRRKLATVVGRTELTILATVDVRPTTLEAARSAGPFATANTCGTQFLLLERLQPCLTVDDLLCFVLGENSTARSLPVAIIGILTAAVNYGRTERRPPPRRRMAGRKGWRWGDRQTAC